ncbi:MAG: DUF4026 domain-containing protein [Butyrivibrio sp.]|nr:DUF4026 domain-containing protein [Muribaculum sp.]MCM1553312.1 DUF4026 domain-containing protein [Butyrivibrio sp.]
MFFNKKKNSEELKEAPLAYWEEQSYMMALTASKDGTGIELSEDMFDRVRAIEGLTLTAKSLPTAEAPGKLIFEYDGEKYEAGFFTGDFQMGPYLVSVMQSQNYLFTENEKSTFMLANTGLTLFMQFHEDCKKSYHVQLKLLVAMVPNLIGILDESAEKIISARWAVMAANSAITPGPEDLFIAQAVSDKGGEVWLHTHGLCRCGLMELEVLQSDAKHYTQHYQLLSTFASHLLDKGEPFIPGKSSRYIGVLTNGYPVVVTCLPWTEAIKEYKKLVLGGANERKDAHNSKTCPIFVYKSEEDEKNGKLSKVSEYDHMWGDNPMFFISNEETDRMRALARERFHFVREQAGQTGNKVIIKLGLLRDDSNGNPNEREHIWFELLGFEGDKFRAKLLQEPYAVASMHEGDEGVYSIDDVTDWLIYTPAGSVDPGKAYILTREIWGVGAENNENH